MKSGPISRIRIGQVGLAEAGNLGDDLILLAALRAIWDALPEANVRHLSYGFKLDWTNLESKLNLRGTREPILASREAFELLRAPLAFGGCSAILFGGGGLLETSHHPYRPYHWLRYLGVGKFHPPTLAVGLGIGPLSTYWHERLRREPKPFDQCWVRDEDSAKLADYFRWDARVCRDYVDAELMAALGLPSSPPFEGPLGVALRAWPGLEVESMACHIDETARRLGAASAIFFVLESRHGFGPDVDFTRAVRDLTRTPSQLLVYQSTNLLEVATAMARCPWAISMKLHSSAIWSHVGSALFPIVYAPKVAALFGISYRGLEVLPDPLIPPDARPSEDVPAASAVVRKWLPTAVGSDSSSDALGWRDHAHGITQSALTELLQPRDARPTTHLGVNRRRG